MREHHVDDVCGLDVTEVSRCLRAPGHEGECSSLISVAVRLPEVVRELCVACLGHQGGECNDCNGSGYILVSPYAPGRGEGGDDFSDFKKPGVKSVLGRVGPASSPPSPERAPTTFEWRRW